MKIRLEYKVILLLLIVAAGAAAALVLRERNSNSVAVFGHDKPLDEPDGALTTRRKQLHISENDRRQLGGSSLVEVIDTAASQAKAGDAAAAYSLFEELRQCAFLDRQLEELQRGVGDNDVSTKSANSELKSLDSKLERCKGISEESAKSYLDWLDLAARHGNVQAQVAYVSEFGMEARSEAHRFDTAWLEDYKAKSVRYLQTAADSGDVNAMLALATTYWTGDIVPQDKVRAYAYWYAVVQSGLVPQSELALDSWGATMSAEEVERAKKMSNLLVQ